MQVVPLAANVMDANLWNSARGPMGMQSASYGHHGLYPNYGPGPAQELVYPTHGVTGYYHQSNQESYHGEEGYMAPTVSSSARKAIPKTKGGQERRRKGDRSPAPAYGHFPRPYGGLLFPAPMYTAPSFVGMAGPASPRGAYY